MARLSEDMMFRAVVANEKQYDGVFFYAVRTTGIVCRPSCKSKAPNRDNVMFFCALEDALKQGYRPCKRCRPDLGPRYMPEEGPVGVACDIINQEYFKPELLHELPSRLHISSSHFQRIFKKVVGLTPKEYLKKLRIDKAAELFDNSTMSNTDICLAAGFSNLSSFYAAFRTQMGLSPKEYRHQQSIKRDLQ
jgi:Adenosine deaminase